MFLLTVASFVSMSLRGLFVWGFLFVCLFFGVCVCVVFCLFVCLFVVVAVVFPVCLPMLLLFCFVLFSVTIFAFSYLKEDCVMSVQWSMVSAH